MFILGNWKHTLAIPLPIFFLSEKIIFRRDIHEIFFMNFIFLLVMEDKDWRLLFTPDIYRLLLQRHHQFQEDVLKIIADLIVLQKNVSNKAAQPLVLVKEKTIRSKLIFIYNLHKPLPEFFTYWYAFITNVNMVVFDFTKLLIIDNIRIVYPDERRFKLLFHVL